MSREKGSVYFSSGFEIQKVIPLDARQLVGRYADLTLSETWQDDDSLIWLYDGAIVAVSNDVDQTKNGIYWLCDSAHYDMTCSWIQVGTGTGTITGATNGLSLFDNGTTIGLGGSLISGTTIAITSGTSLTINDLRTTPVGIQYNGDYTTTFNNNSLVSKKYVDTVAIGLHPKTAVWVATTIDDGYIDLNGGTFSGTIDGVVLEDGDRVLIKNQNGIIPDIENGIYGYSADTNTFYRSPDFDGSPEGDFSRGDLVPLLEGDTNKNTLWALITNDPIKIGETPLSFTPFVTPGDYEAGIGIHIENNSIISVSGASLVGNSLVWTGDTFNVDITSGTLATALASKLDVSVFSGYTGTTENRLEGIEDNITYISGITDTKLNISVFNEYTGTTETRLQNIEDDIDYISGQTLSISIFTGYTATTETRLQGIESDISYISGITDTKLDTLIFANYTGTTQSILDAALTGATNGLTKDGRNVCLGGSLTKNTIFTGGASNYHLQYAGDYSNDYITRSIPDVGYVTGYTQSAITNNSNVLNVVDVTTTAYTATQSSDFIGASGGTTIYLPFPPKNGQRIVVADIGGNALELPITIHGNGIEIVGGESVMINTNFGSITFIYNTKGFWSTAAFIN